MARIIGHIAVDLHPAVHRAGVHHDGVIPRQREPLPGEAIQVPVFARGGDELPVHPLVLEAQHHHHVRARQSGIEMMEHLHPHRLYAHGHQRGRRAQAHRRAQRLQAQDVGARHAAMQDIAADRHGKAGELPVPARFPPRGQRVAQREGIKQPLRGMFVLPVACVENRAIYLSRNQAYRAGRSVADDNGIGAHRIQRLGRVDQRFALLHARLRGVHVHHIRTQPLARDLEREKRARGIFEEGIDDRQPSQRIAMLRWLAVEAHPVFRFIEQKQDLVRLQRANRDQVAVRKGPATGGIAGWRRWILRRCH